MANAVSCLQLDPINVVARPQVAIPFSRMGPYKERELDKLCWEQKRLFSYWAHAASLVPTEQFPIHKVFMRLYQRGQSAWGKRHIAWAKENPKLGRHILAELRKRGALRTKDFKDHAVQGYTSGGWNEGRNVDMMLDYLWTCGKVMIAGRDGINRIWDLAERWLPDWTPTETISTKEATRRSVLIALRSLGVATVKQIGITFTRWRYYDMPRVIAELERAGTIVPVRVMDRDASLPGKWYGLKEVLEAPRPRGRSRTTVLSPFDPLIADRQRLKLLFGFDYSIEIYVPKTKRKYGYYVMPVLHDGELVGRVDPVMDRKSGTLTINGAWAEPRHNRGDTTEAIAAA
ncbi:MAG: winged helix DNA-binding domain-containing protein, partial [Actinomycetota bacterium]|nr:winged helix DNA-binding domain-containing protein [Actinomycetota bacterium]